MKTNHNDALRLTYDLLKENFFLLQDDRVKRLQPRGWDESKAIVKADTFNHAMYIVGEWIDLMHNSATMVCKCAGATQGTVIDHALVYLLGKDKKHLNEITELVWKELDLGQCSGRCQLCKEDVLTIVKRLSYVIPEGVRDRSKIVSVG